MVDQSLGQIGNDKAMATDELAELVLRHDHFAFKAKVMMSIEFTRDSILDQAEETLGWPASRWFRESRAPKTQCHEDADGSPSLILMRMLSIHERIGPL